MRSKAWTEIGPMYLFCLESCGLCHQIDIHTVLHEIIVFANLHSSMSTVGRAVVVLQPNWSHIFTEETITLRCEIEGRGDMDLNYEWQTPRTSRYKPENTADLKINRASVSHSGDYRCKGHDLQSSTGWSDAVKLTVSRKSEYVL